METVEEKANDYARTRLCRTCDKCTDPRCFGCYNEAKQSYIADYTEANKWISVKDELPPVNTVVICKINNENKGDIGYTTGSYTEHGFWLTPMDFMYPDGEFKPTHWRPIN